MNNKGKGLKLIRGVSITRLIIVKKLFLYQDFNILGNSCILVYYRVDHCKQLFLYQDFNILGNYCKLREYIFHHHALEIFT